MTLLKDNNYKEINVALLSLEADIKNKMANNFDTSVIDKQLAEINSRIDKINAGGNNTSAAINDIRYEIEDINSKLKGNSAKIENIEQKLADIFSAENKVTDFNTTTNSGIYYWVEDAANKPANYGVLLVNKYDSGSNSLWINQIAYSTTNKIYFRQNINSGNWTEWKAVAFDGEITAKKVANALTVNGKTYDGSSAVDAGVQTVANGGTGVTTQADINKAFIGNLEEGVSDVTDGTEFVSSWASDNGFAETAEGAVNTPYKRKFSKVWNYIKGKISSVLGLTETKLTLQGGTVSSNSYTDTNPKIEFKNIDGSQNISLTFTDFDAVQEPASLTLNGNQGNEYFIAPNIKATGSFYGNLSGKSAQAGFLTRYSSTRLTSGNIVPKDASEYGGMRKDVVTSSITDSGRLGIDGQLLTMFWDSDGRWDTQLFLTCEEPPALKVRVKENTADYGPWVDVITSNNIGSQTVAKANSAGSAGSAGTADSLFYRHGNEINFKGGAPNACYFNWRNADTEGPSPVDTMQYIFCNYSSDTSKSVIKAGSFDGTTAKASSKMVIPIGAPSSLEDGCIWIS